MAFLTDRKRATGMGSRKIRHAHFWSMKVSSVALLILIPFSSLPSVGILGSHLRRGYAYLRAAFPGDCSGSDDPASGSNISTMARRC